MKFFQNSIARRRPTGLYYLYGDRTYIQPCTLFGICLFGILTTQFSLSVISFGKCAILRFSNLLLRAIRVLEAILLSVGQCLLYKWVKKSIVDCCCKLLPLKVKVNARRVWKRPDCARGRARLFKIPWLPNQWFSHFDSIVIFYKRLQRI